MERISSNRDDVPNDSQLREIMERSLTEKFIWETPKPILRDLIRCEIYGIDAGYPSASLPGVSAGQKRRRRLEYSSLVAGAAAAAIGLVMALSENSTDISRTALQGTELAPNASAQADLREISERTGGGNDYPLGMRNQ
ncbi:hypothetical protein [Streptomyces sp. NPDC088748]|uniref:hypothetical protein n=1 Tax=Streptomyces sp. NPDC088748 TaxID=3365887 RepID=UPI003816E291